MSAELPFEYSQRRNALIRQILEGDQASQEAAMRAIEEGDRELEDYLASLNTGGGGTLQSLIEVKETNGGSHGFDGNRSGTLTDISFDIPADTTFDYYIDWDINGRIWLKPNAEGLYFYAYSQISGTSPGAGFELFGFQIVIPDGWTASHGPTGRYFHSGHGQRCEKLSDSSAGTTVTFQTGYEINAPSGCEGEWAITQSAKLFSIPK